MTFTDGQEQVPARAQLLLHVALHGTYHRGNVGLIIRTNKSKDTSARANFSTQPPLLRLRDLDELLPRADRVACSLNRARAQAGLQILAVDQRFERHAPTGIVHESEALPREQRVRHVTVGYAAALSVGRRRGGDCMAIQLHLDILTKRLIVDLKQPGQR